MAEGLMYGYPDFLAGIPLTLVDPRFVPKIKLRDDAPVSDAFRVEMNAWLLAMFGEEDVTPLRPRVMLHTAFGFLVRRDDMAFLKLALHT